MNQIQKIWLSDLEWVPKSILHEAREKEVKKLQQFETYKKVPLAEAEGEEIISSRSVDKRDESGELRSRLVSRGYESSHADPASLFAATPSVVATRIALVLGLAQDAEMAVADISGAFLHAVLEKRFFVTVTSVSLGVRTWLFREEGSDTQRHDHCGRACGRSPEC